MEQKKISLYQRFQTAESVFIPRKVHCRLISGDAGECFCRKAVNRGLNLLLLSLYTQSLSLLFSV